MKNFETIIKMAANGDIPNLLKITNESSGYDHSVTITEFPFNDLSKEQLKVIKKAFNYRNYINYSYCGCSHDCCGCPCSEINEMMRNENGNFAIKTTLTFNY